MKRKLLTFAMIAALVSVNPVNAQNTKATYSAIKKTDLREIILGDEQVNSELADSSVLIATDTPAINKDPQATETYLNNKTNESTDKKKGFFDIFNLNGGVEKTEGVEAPKEASTEETVVQKWLNGSYATGKWFGARSLLEEHGLTINSSLIYSPDVMLNGGANNGASGKGYSLFNLNATLDTEKAGMWKGGTFYALYQRKTGYGLSGVNGAMGDTQVFDGWDWRQMNQMSEYWYQQKLFNNKLRLKFGKQDANLDFCYLNSGFDFFNTSFSINPTVLLPTYPDQSFGFMAEINPKEWLSIRDGVYSRYNVPFNISEVEIKTKIKKMPGRYIAGGWELSDSTGYNVAAGIDQSGQVYNNTYNRNFGAYAEFEQMVYKEKKDDDNDMQGLIVFGQFGISPSNRNDLSKYFGGGLHYKGPLPKRDNDIAGVAVASGNFAPRLGDITSQIGSETALEAFYRIQVTPWFYLQPDVQYIMSPSGTYNNSVAIGLRSVITF